MNNDQPNIEESDVAIREFWSQSMGLANVGDLDVVFGQQWGEAVAPPAWSYSESAEMADQFVESVLDGTKTAMVSLYQQYPDIEYLPKAKDLTILLDGSGYPRALIQVTDVQVVPFSEVTLEQVVAESGLDDLDSWRQTHQADWESDDFEINGSTWVVWERFKVLYSAKNYAHDDDKATGS